MTRTPDHAEVAIAEAVYQLHREGRDRFSSAMLRDRVGVPLLDSVLLDSLRRMRADGYRSPQGLRLRRVSPGMYESFEVAPHVADIRCICPRDPDDESDPGDAISTCPIHGWSDAKLTPMGSGLDAVTTSDHSLGQRRSLTADDVAAAVSDPVASGRMPQTTPMLPPVDMTNLGRAVSQIQESVAQLGGSVADLHSPLVPARSRFEFAKLGRLGFEVRCRRFTFIADLRHWAVPAGGGLAQETGYVSVLCFGLTYDRTR
jgi:hypothetical protein